MKNKEYTNEDLGVKFGLAEKFSVREVLNLRGRVFSSPDDSWYIRYWDAAIPMLQDWECKEIPNPAEFDLDESFSLRAADIVHWTANTVAAHMAELDEVPKK